MIVHKKEFTIGLILLAIFVAIFAYMWSPSFDGNNAFVYSDDIFNAISKDSSYQIPALLEKAEGQVGTKLDVTFEADDVEMADKMAILFQKAGADVTVNGAEVNVSGDLGAIAKSAINDADEMYKNNNIALEQAYGYDAKEAMYYWWKSFDKMNGSLQNAGEFATASYITDVKMRAVEPGYNFFGIEGMSAKDNVGLISFLLGFYLVYTVLYGFAIYYLFEGVGIMMTSKH
ncbi:hypothetical protein V6C27_10585 [Peptococcaceae bacterium 1198_IL3148]